jgi:hypothetical protein
MSDIEIRDFDEIPRSKRSGLYSEIYDKLMNAIVKSGKRTVGAKFPDRSKAIGFYNWAKDALASDSVANVKGVGIAMRTIDGEVWVFFYVP